MFGLPKLYAYGAAVVVAALILGSAYLKGRSDGKEVVETRYAAALAQAIRETAEKEAELRNILGERDELRKELAAARDYGKSVGDRLRDYQSRRCALPDTTGVAAGTERAAQVASLVERIRRLDERIADLNGRVVEACSGEAKQLETLLDRYEAARQAQNTP